MTLLLSLAFLAFGFVCFALGLWVGRLAPVERGREIDQSVIMRGLR